MQVCRQIERYDGSVVDTDRPGKEQVHSGASTETGSEADALRQARTQAHRERERERRKNRQRKQEERTTKKQAQSCLRVTVYACTYDICI